MAHLLSRHVSKGVHVAGCGPFSWDTLPLELCVFYGKDVFTFFKFLYYYLWAVGLGNTAIWPSRFGPQHYSCHVVGQDKAFWWVACTPVSSRVVLAQEEFGSFKWELGNHVSKL